MHILQLLWWKALKPKKSNALTIRFEDDLKEFMLEVSKQTGLSEAEIVRLCVRRQMEEIRRAGKIELTLKLT